MYRVRPKINNIRQKAIEQGRNFTCAGQAGLFLLAWRVHHKHLVMSPQRSSAHSQCPSPSAAKAYLQEGRAQVFTAWVRRVRWHQLLTHSLRCLKQALKNALLSSKGPFWTQFIIIIIIWVSKTRCLFFFFLNVLLRFPLCTNVQYPQNLGIKHWCSAAVNVCVLRVWPSEHKWELSSLQTCSFQSQRFAFSPVISQYFRNNQNFKPRALQHRIMQVRTFRKRWKRRSVLQISFWLKNLVYICMGLQGKQQGQSL